MQDLLETNAVELLKRQSGRGKKMLTIYCSENTVEVLDAWHKLAERLYVKYNDGYLNTAEEIGRPLFYPSWWLEKSVTETDTTDYRKKNNIFIIVWR